MILGAGSVKIWLVSGVMACIFFISMLFSTSSSQRAAMLPAYIANAGISTLRETNRTLGFQKVFAINMPERVDKRDGLAVVSGLTGFDIEVVPGYKAESLDEKWVPDGWESKSWDVPTLGCWRGHLNVAQRIIRENIRSALIMEDDADWDITLKHQLPEIAKGMRHLTQSASHPDSPYGDGWDVLWLGHCGASNLPDKNGQESAYYIIDDDPTVVNQVNRFYVKPNTTPEVMRYTNSTRVVMPVRTSRCLFAYALSLQGAYKLLARQSLEQKPHPIDRAVARMCGGKDLTCFGVDPPLFGSFKAAGNPNKDSDRQTIQGEVREKPVTRAIKFPAFHNFRGLIYGSRKFASQYPDEPYAELDLDTFEYPVGRAEVIDKSEFVFKTD